MIAGLIAIAALTARASCATLVVVARDGYAPVPDRPWAHRARE